MAKSWLAWLLWLAMAAMAMAKTHNPLKYIQTNKKEYIRVDDN